MLNCSVFIATSADGFIARADGSIDWLEKVNASVPAGTDLGFERFFASVDVLIMGRKTFEMAMSFSQWPYADKAVIVLSRSLSGLPAGTPGSVTLSHELPAALVQRLSAEGFSHAYVDGGLTIQSFLAKGLIDDMTITVVPVLLGQGLPLFGPLAQDVALEMIASQAFPFGFVQTHYRVAKN